MRPISRLAIASGALAATLAALVVPTQNAPAAPTSTAAGAPTLADLSPAPGARAVATGAVRDVMWVGNNWDGTASIVDARSFKVLKRGVNLIPDEAQELADITADPAKLALFIAIRVGPGEGHDQYVDDMFTTRDGRYLAVSRPSFADVVWIDVRRATLGRPGAIVREQQMDGFRTDHMALSPNGLRLLVSDSTSRQVIEYAMVDRHAGQTAPRSRWATGCGPSPPAKRRTRATTPRTAAGSSTPRSAGSTPPATAHAALDAL